MVTCETLPSSACHEFPGPSPESWSGHNVFRMSLNCESVDGGDASTSALCSGIGTRDEEYGDAPGEKGTLGLFVLLIGEPPNVVVKEPAKIKWELGWARVID